MEVLFDSKNTQDNVWLGEEDAQVTYERVSEFVPDTKKYNQRYYEECAKIYCGGQSEE